MWRTMPSRVSIHCTSAVLGLTTVAEIGLPRSVAASWAVLCPGTSREKSRKFGEAAVLHPMRASMAAAASISVFMGARG